jgi:hypothetical protein
MVEPACRLSAKQGGDKLDRVSVNPYCRTKVPQVGDLVAEGVPGALGSARRPQLAGRMPVQSPS